MAVERRRLLTEYAVQAITNMSNPDGSKLNEIIEHIKDNILPHQESTIQKIHKATFAKLLSQAAKDGLIKTVGTTRTTRFKIRKAKGLVDRSCKKKKPCGQPKKKLCIPPKKVCLPKIKKRTVKCSPSGSQLVWSNVGDMDTTAQQGQSARRSDSTDSQYDGSNSRQDASASSGSNASGVDNSKESSFESDSDEEPRSKKAKSNASKKGKASSKLPASKKLGKKASTTEGEGPAAEGTQQQGEGPAPDGTQQQGEGPAQDGTQQQGEGPAQDGTQQQGEGPAAEGTQQGEGLGSLTSDELANQENPAEETTHQASSDTVKPEGSSTN